ncbi:Regulator of telomere elongation helicase [Senna tora]|uniref:Regulator of telomere elongation helicase n=1 Tax=Senna tora TaxID=362788 RepID=A0A835CBA6_9FABA|nr:Regulator of telomere elongation helicase [Senna tora]
MLMSIFSSFDALCAEFSYGQKSRFSLRNAISKPKSEESTEKKQRSPDSSSSKAAPSTQSGGAKQQRRQLTPRFAPELDGVHCFESIVPY